MKQSTRDLIGRVRIGKTDAMKSAGHFARTRLAPGNRGKAAISQLYRQARQRQASHLKERSHVSRRIYFGLGK
jgi:hypothetical protein